MIALAAHTRPSAFIRVHLRTTCLSLASFVAASSVALAQLAPAPAKPAAHAAKYMVAAAHPLAVQAGLAMLERGGSAVDAMIAAQLVLNLVEPESSGLGGGAYLLVYDAKARAVRAYDARETAPLAADARLFLRADGQPMRFAQARVGGRSVGVPGTPRLLEIAHVRHGKLPWKTLFEPAIALAERGFPVSPRLHELIARERGLADEPATRAYFFDASGAPRAAGSILRNPAFAATLRRLAADGMDAFYEGALARDIVAAVHAHRNPGVLEEGDLEAYRVRDVEALCRPYRAWTLCGMPPSSSGGIAVLQVLGELERFDLAAVRPASAQAIHLVAEAERLAFADRNRYVADDRYVDVPVQGLLDPGYLAARAALIRPERSMGVAHAGTPAGAKTAFADDAVDEAMGTSQIAIVDGAGNAVAMTTTIEWSFGSHVMAGGFLLNNELTDFNFLPLDRGGAVANRLEPGKRPRSSMAPFVVLDRATGAFDMALGSPGGSLIIGYVAKTLLAVLDWKMDVQSAIAFPNFGSRNGATEIERGTELERLVPALRAMGHEVRALEMTSGAQAVRRVGRGLEGGADPRREGVARGR